MGPDTLVEIAGEPEFESPRVMIWLKLDQVEDAAHRHLDAEITRRPIGGSDLRLERTKLVLGQVSHALSM